MKISIVIPTYNAERYLPLTLDSVLAQTHQDWELITMDDGSRDSTRSIAEAYAARDSRIQAMHQENAGVAAARNSGFALTSSRSEAVIFLDNDDLWEPETLTALIGGLAENPAAVGAYVVARYIDGDGSPSQPGVLEDWTRTRRRLTEGRAAACQLEEPTTFACFAIEQCLLTPGVLLVRRTALMDVQQGTGQIFDPVTVPSDDYDLYLQLTRRGGLALVDRVLFGYRLHSDNASYDKRKLHRSERTVRRRQIANPKNTPEQKRLLRMGFRLREREAFRSRTKDAAASLLRWDLSAAARAFLYGQANLLRSLHGRP